MISKIMKKMIDFSNGNVHDINHFIKVHSFAKTIGEFENLNPYLLENLEIAAVIHDISCPLCRKKYNSTNGKFQEAESEPLVREFLEEFQLKKERTERIVFIVSHHHTYKEIDGDDYQILLEADYLVNADEENYSKQNIANAKKAFFKTKTGIELINSIYGV